MLVVISSVYSIKQQQKARIGIRCGNAKERKRIEIAYGNAEVNVRRLFEIKHCTL